MVRPGDFVLAPSPSQQRPAPHAIPSRYNNAVGAQWGVVPVSSLKPAGGTPANPKDTNTPVVPMPSNPAFYLVGRAAERATASSDPGLQALQEGMASAHGLGAGGSGSGSGGGRSGRVAAGAVKAAPDSILAAWLGVPAVEVRRLLAQHPPLAQRSWAVWREHVEAVELLLHQIQHPEAMGLRTAAGVGSGRRADAAGGGRGGNSDGNSGSGGSGGIADDVEANDWAGTASLGRGHGGRTFQHAGSADVASDAQNCGVVAPEPHIARVARARLASPSTHRAALAALCIAANVAEFSSRLWHPPAGSALPATGAMLLACPAAWAADRGGFVVRCRWLSALAAASTELAADLQQMPLTSLAHALHAPRPTYELLQYLVATRQPLPWAVSVEALLHRPARKSTVPAGLKAAYPGFSAWRKGMKGTGGGGGGSSGSGGSCESASNGSGGSDGFAGGTGKKEAGTHSGSAADESRSIDSTKVARGTA
jgi:hypothetical protein